jgi:Tat protein translocase TatB subunit
MFGIGMPEFLLILVVALVVLGPKRLPELARSLGRGLAELKKTTGDLKQNIDFGDDLTKVQKDLQDVKNDLSGIVDKTLLEDNLTDYFKAAEHQTEAFPEPDAAAEPVSPVTATPPAETERSPVITGEAEDIRRELEEMADRTYREHYPYTEGPLS